MRTRTWTRERHRTRANETWFKLLALFLITADSFARETRADALTAGTIASKAEAQAPAQSQNGAEQQITAQRRIIVSLTDRKLVLLEDQRLLKVYPVAVGTRKTPSPKGQFTIISRVTSPAWYYRGRVVPPGNSNPLGTRWIGLSRKGYGIHGTNAPSSIGHAASHGCIRMRRTDLEELFAAIRPGDAVEIRDRIEAKLMRRATDTRQSDAYVGDPRVRTVPPPASTSASRAGAVSADGVPGVGLAVNTGVGL